MSDNGHDSQNSPTPQADQAATDAPPQIQLTSLRLRPAALDAIIMSPAGVYVTGSAARRADTAFPRLVSHVCVSGGHQRFGEEIIGTEPAHLVEHLAIELMIQTAIMAEREQAGASTPNDRQLREEHTYTGHTSQVNRLPSDDPGMDPYQVSISYDNDLVAIRALRYACDIAEWVMRADDDARNGRNVSIPSFVGVIKDLYRYCKA